MKKPIEHIALKCNYDINDFNDIIKSITRAMDFFQFFLTDLVVDAAVGTRIVQGMAMSFLSKVGNTFYYLRPTSAYTKKFQFTFGNSNATGAVIEKYKIH